MNTSKFKIVHAFIIINVDNLLFNQQNCQKLNYGYINQTA